MLAIEAGGLADGQTCTTTVFVATRRASSGKGHGKKAAKFEPVSCLTATSDSGIQIFDTVALSHGVRTFDGATKYLLAGPTDLIQLKPAWQVRRPPCAPGVPTGYSGVRRRGFVPQRPSSFALVSAVASALVALAALSRIRDVMLGGVRLERSPGVGRVAI